MKRLKTLTIVAITGLTGTMVLNASGMGYDESNCGDRAGMMEKHGADIGHGMHRGDGRMGHGMHRGDHRHGIVGIIKHLDLTDTQKQKLKDLRSDFRKNMQEHRKTTRKSQEMAKFISSDGFDKAGFVANSESKIKERVSARADMMEKAFAILTAEQRVELVKELKKRRADKSNMQ